MSASVDDGREVLETLSRREADRLVELCDPEVEWHSFFADLRASGMYRGYEGIRQYIADLTEAFEMGRLEADGGLAVDDVVVLVGRIHYRGKESGFETSSPAGWMLKFRAGKVLRFRALRDPAEALEAVGLCR